MHQRLDWRRLDRINRRSREALAADGDVHRLGPARGDMEDGPVLGQLRDPRRGLDARDAEDGGLVERGPVGEGCEPEPACDLRLEHVAGNGRLHVQHPAPLFEQPLAAGQAFTSDCPRAASRWHRC